MPRRESIPQQVWQDVIVWMQTSSTTYLNVFVAGGNHPNSLRGRVRKALELEGESGRARMRRAYVYYPEEYFTTLAQHMKADLMQLENVMAKHVDIIIVCPESAGSFSELGAFANSEAIRDKIFVINDQSHSPYSFISLGPLRSVSKSGKNHVQRIDTQDNVKIAKACHSIVRTYKKNAPFIGMFECQRALMLMLFLFEEMPDNALREMFVVSLDAEGSAVFDAVCDNLFSSKVILRRPGGLRLSAAGVMAAERLVGIIQVPFSLVDSFRLLALSWILRAG